MSERQTLLIVDDEPDILDFLGRVFRKRYRILRADSPDRAIALSADDTPDLLICDHKMPGMTGLDLMRHIAASHPQTTRVLLSGFSDLPEISAAAESGLVHAYVVKPVDSEALTAAIEEAEDRRARGDWTV